MNRVSALVLFFAFGLIHACSEPGDGRGSADIPSVGFADTSGAETVEPADLGGSEDAATDALDVSVDVDALLCQPGQRVCQSPQQWGVCNDEGSGYVEFGLCDEGAFCDPSDGSCYTYVCNPGERRCGDNDTFQVCDADGKAWGALAPCEADTFCLEGFCLDDECKEANVMFAVDGSSSMTGEWGSLGNSIATVTANNPDVSYGLTMFPSGIGCSTASSPQVAITDDGGAAVNGWLSSNGASGGATPLTATLEWFADNVASVWGANPDNGYLIVMTEGYDTCSCKQYDRFDFFEEQEWEACVIDELTTATQAIVALGIKVYVIGYKYSGSYDLLNAIAANGGTPLTDFIYAGNEASLTNAFDTIISDLKLCL